MKGEEEFYRISCYFPHNLISFFFFSFLLPRKFTATGAEGYVGFIIYTYNTIILCKHSGTVQWKLFLLPNEGRFSFPVGRKKRNPMFLIFRTPRLLVTQYNQQFPACHSLIVLSLRGYHGLSCIATAFTLQMRCPLPG